MEQTVKTVSPAKSAVSYGVVVGAILILELIIMFILKPDPIENAWTGIVMNLLNWLVLPVLFITLACNNYKNKHNGGFVSFGQCLKIGVSVMVIGAVLYSIFYLIFNMIFPEYLPDMIALIERATRAQNPNMPEEQLEITVSMMSKFMQPAVAIPMSIVMNAFIGLIISLIVGAIVKRDNPAAAN
ncbi:MAG: DUF4199 domain-containing protein [Flavobacterium sp.]